MANKLLEDEHPTHYLPNVGRQVMADGGVPSIDQIRQMMIGTAPAPSSPSPGAYTDPYGLKVAAPFVESMRGGYPTAPTPPRAAEPEAKPTETNPWLRKLRETLGGMGLSGRFGYAEGGEVEGDVQFLEDDKAAPLPTFAQPETQAVTQALDAARAAQPREAEMRAYEPTLREKIYGAVAGTSEARPTAERASFAKGIADILGYTPLLGQAMQAQESARAGDSKGVAMAMLPMPAGRAGAAAEEAATNIARRVVNPLGMHSEAAEVARSLPQQKGTIEQMLAMMKNKVNPEEIHWSGIEKAFQPGQKVTAEELASHFESKLPQVQETVYGGGEANIHVPGKPHTQEFEGHYGVVQDNYENDLAEDMFGKSYHELEPHEIRQVDDAVYNMAVDTAIEGGIFIHPPESGGKAPRYPTYVTPGGENYREIVLHHPVSRVEDPKGGRMITYKVDENAEPTKILAFPDQIQKMQEKGFIVNDLGPATMDAPTFTESHHDEPNVLGHIRMSDMTGPQGEKILNVHEFQSDWGQKARSKGVSGNRNQLEKELESIKEELKKAQKIHDAKIKEWQELVNNNDSMTLEELYNHPIYMEMDKTRQAVIDADVKRQLLAKKSFGVPAAPYVTSREGQHNTPGWTDMLIKRVLQEAEKGGYHKVVWDTPAEQGERYSNLPQIVKGMQGYYGDVLPRRFKKVVPEVKLGEHEVGQPRSLIDNEGVADWLTYQANLKIYKSYRAAKSRMPDAGPEQWLKASGAYNGYVINLGAKNEIRPLQSLDIIPPGGPVPNHFTLYDMETGDELGRFSSKAEAENAKKTHAANEIIKKLNPGVSKRPGFDVTPELLERIRKGLPAYRDGGEVDDALALARSL